MYQVTDKCLLCRYPYACIYNCPAEAIFNNGNHAEIDQDKCIHCGKCVGICNLCAIIDTDAPEEVVVPHDLVEQDCDILILGGGAAGLIAALRASEQCTGKILVLEKAKKPGGCGIYSSALRMFDTQWEKDHGNPEQMDDYIRSAFNTTRGLLNPQLIANGFRAIPRFFDWFCQWGDAEKGFKYDDEHPLQGMRVTSILPDNAGHDIMGKVIQQLRQKGVEILTETAATEFIMEKGRVAGVRASDPGGNLTIHCKTCLVAMGNIGNNQQILDRYVPEYGAAYKRPTMHLLPTCTGDFIPMAEKAGIPIDEASIVPAYLGPMNTMFNMQTMMQPARPDVLNVNMEGKRWKSESFRGEACNWLLLKQPQAVTWAILDTPLACNPPKSAPPVLFDNSFGRMISNGVPDQNGTPKSAANVMNLGPAGGLPAQPGATSEGIIAGIEAAIAVKGKYVVKGDTIEELAANMGVPYENLKATIDRYNELCKKGHDDDFFKQSDLMIPIETGPFYAFHCHMGTDGVFGGFYIDENMRVIGTDGPIPGLYAAGDNTGGRYVNQGGEKKKIINDFSWAVGSGMLAGENMATYWNQLVNE